MKSLMILSLTIAAVFSAEANGVCPNADRYCLSCNGTACSSCAYSYLDTAGKCQPPTTMLDYCTTYQSATVCGGCEHGYYLNSAKSCVEIAIDDCEATLTNAGAKCSVCDDGNRADSATGKCTETACGITNCELCSVVALTAGTDTVTCVECSNGYAFTTSNTCAAEVTANCGN